MKDKRFWSGVLLLGAVAGIIGLLNGKFTRVAPPAETRKPATARALATNGSGLLSVAAARARQAAPGIVAGANGTPVAPRETVAVFQEFSAWAAGFLASPPDQRGNQPIEEGIRLAKERRDTLARIIRVNPKLAVEMAAPRHWRTELPAAIGSLLEEQPSARGNLEVYCALPLPGADHHETEGGTIRYVTFGEQSYRAYVYGRRVRQMTRHDVALHGVAVEGVMAVAEEPLRLMEAGESNAGEAEACTVCGVKAGAIRADHGGRALAFCSAAHAAEMSRTLAAAEDATPLAAALESPGNTPPPISPAGTFGPKKVLYIRVVFADDATVPIEAAEAQAVMDEVNHFYVESSYNKTALISSITPLVTLAQGKMYYAAQGPGALARDARAGALAAGFEAGNYDLVLIRHTNVPGFTWGGLGGGGTAWLQTSSAGVIAHELGHNYGLPHANYWDTRRDTLPADPNTFPFDVDSLVGRDTVIGPGDDVSYGDVHDVMGGGGGESTPPAGETNVISALNGHFNPVGKSLLGWLPDAYVLPADQGASARLYVHDTASLVAGRVYAVTARKDEQRTYWVSARSRFPNDPTLLNGVELHWGPWQQSLGYSHLLDTTPGTKAAQGDATLLLGRTFSDRASDIHITPVAKGGAGVESWFDLVVNKGPFSNNVPPDVQFTFTAEETIVGSNVTFTAKATDANGDRIAHFWDFGDGTFGTNAATVTKAWPNPGDYVVRCEVSDLKGGLTVKHAVVRVGFPTTLRISGRVIDTFGQPVAGARVSNGSLTNNTDLADDYSWTYTDSDGAYTLVNLAPNTVYPIGIYLDGYVTRPLNFVTPVTLTDRDAVNANFEAQPLPRVSVTTGRDAGKAPATPGFFQLTRTGDISVPLRALFVLGGTAGTNDYQAYTNVVQQTNSNPNPFGVITNLITFQYIDFAAGAATTNLTITPSTNAASGEDKYLSLTIMYALQAQRVTMATNTNTVNFTGWVITPVNGRDTWFQTDPDYIPGSPAEAKLLIRGPAPSRPTVSVVALDATVTENRNDAGMFLVTRFGRLDQAVTVTLESGGTAVAGSDYDPLPVSVTIPAGQTTLRVPVLVRPNQFLDGNKTVELTVRADPAYQVGAAKATVTIVDNDLAQVTIVALDAAIPGRDTARGTFQITRTGDLTRELVVNYLVTGSAISGEDYRALPGSVTLVAGQPSATISVTPRNSTRPKGERVLTILLADSPVYNAGFPNEASLVIQDATLSFVTVSTPLDRMPEGAAGLFLLHREGDLSRSITVHFSLGGTATPLVDYAGVSDRVTFPAFINEMPILVSLTADGLLEDPSETVSLRIEPGAGYNVSSPNQATFTITDNDSGQPAVGFAQLTSSGPEASGTNLVTVAVTGNPAEGADVTVDYKIIGGTAKAGLDYPTNVSSGRLVFVHATNSTPETAFLLRSLQIPIPFLDNSNAQPNRTIVIGLFEPAPTVTNEIVTNIVADPMNAAVMQTNVVTNIVVTPVPMNATFGTYKSHTITILDDDASIVTVVASETVASEAGLHAGAFTIRRSKAQGAQKVFFQLSGSATPGSDYQAPASPIEIPNGIDSVTIPILPVDDPVQEYMEAVTLTLLSAPGAQLGGERSATVSIQDNDGTVEFTATAFTTVESAGVAFIPIRRTGDASVPAAVEYTFTGGSAVAGVDYVATNGIVNFAAGETTGQVPVTILDDALVEPSKTVSLLLRNAGDRSPLGGQSTAVVTILDDDTAVEFTQASFRAPENATNAVVTVRRIGVATNAFTVDYLVSASALTNRAATEGVDYAPTNGTLNFGPGQTEATFQVRLLNDALLEGDEAAHLVLTNATGGAVLGLQAGADLVIVDDECQIEFALPENRVPEYAGTASVVVRRNGGTVLPATVSFATKPGTAKAGRDFVSVAGTVSFSGDSFVLPVDGSGVPVFVPGESEKTIQVRILDNAVGEGDRQFTLDLSNPRGPTGTLANSITLGTGTNTLVTIVDDETPGQVDFHYNPGLGTDRRVHTVALQTDGKTLLGGEFTTVDGIVFNRLARLHDDGYLDSSLNPGAGASDTVFAIAAQPDGRILAGGDFLQINGSLRGRVSRLNGDGTVDETFDPGSGADERVRAITIQNDGAILIGGEFATVNDESRSGVARLNPDGSLDQTFDPGTGASGGVVRSIAAQADGKILVGGSFVVFGGGTRPYLARLNAAGTVDNSFAATGTPNGAVYAIAVQADGKIVIGGEFTTVGGQSRKGIARLLPDGALDTGFDPGTGANATVFAVGLQADGKILAGGAFTNFNGIPLNRLARLNPEGSVDDGFDIGSGANGIVRALVLQPDGAIVIGGDFTIVRDLPRNHIARVHGDDKFTLNKLQFAAAGYRIAEDQGLATITVRRSGDTTGATTVGYETADATALAGVNYLPAQGVLQFAPGETQQSFAVKVLNDGVARGDTTVKLLLTNIPSGFSLSARLSATLTIEGVEGAVNFTASDYTVGESEGVARIGVSLTRPSSVPVTVAYVTLNDSATNGVDYLSGSGDLIFAPGETNQTILVSIINENLPRPDRSLRLQLSNPRGGAALGQPSQAILTIADDDRGPSFRVAIANVAGGTVTPAGGSFPAGTVKSFTATPARDFQFVRWEGSTNSTLNPLTLVLNRDYSLTPVFRPQAYTYSFVPPFSAGDLTKAPWHTSGDSPWQIVPPAEAGSGDYALRSGDIADNQQSKLELTAITREGSGSFDVRVSSEEAWDFLEFYLNDTLQHRWSGDVPWESFQFQVSAGENRFTWRYAKDGNFSSRLDAAFISNLYLPVAGSGSNLPPATLRAFLTATGSTRLQLQGQPGYEYTVEASNDLVHWQVIATSQVNGSTTVSVTDPDAGKFPQRFYRAITR